MLNISAQNNDVFHVYTCHKMNKVKYSKFHLWLTYILWRKSCKQNYDRSIKMAMQGSMQVFALHRHNNMTGTNSSITSSWSRHQMETLSTLLAFVSGNHRSPGKSPRTKASDAELWFFIDLRLNKRLSKQSRHRWFETPSRSLWRHGVSKRSQYHYQ